MKVNRPRKSAWNLILLPFAVAAMCLTGWLLALPVLYMRHLDMPDKALISGGSDIGLIFFYVGLMICSVGPGLLVGNLMGWLFVPLRHILDRDAAERPKEDFKSSCMGLLKFSLAVLAITYPASFLGGINGFSITTEGIYYRKPFSFQVSQYTWDRVREVKTTCYSKRAAGYGYFDLVLDDQTTIDLLADTPADFFPVYPSISMSLRNKNFKFTYDQPPPMYRDNPCPKSWVPYLTRAP